LQNVISKFPKVQKKSPYFHVPFNNIK